MRIECWCRLRGLNPRPSVYKTTTHLAHHSPIKLLAAPQSAAEGAEMQQGAASWGQFGDSVSEMENSILLGVLSLS